MKKRLRTAVIGVGKMGANHARVYTDMDGCDLVGVYDADRGRARSLADQLKCTAFQTLTSLYRAELDAVTVAVPTSLHADAVVDAFANGLNVLVEKPIASTLDEAEGMIEAAEAAGKALMVGHIERFNPAVLAVKDSVAPEDIISINIVRVGPRPPRIKDAGVIIDMAVHDIDLVLYLTGQPVEAVHCVASSHFDLFEDTASILLRMAGGASAQITANWITPYKAREIQVITAEKLLRANLLTQHLQEASRYEGDDMSYLVRDRYVRHREPLRSQLQAFLDCVRNDATPPISGEDGLRVLDVAIQAVSQKQITPLRVAS